MSERTRQTTCPGVVDFYVPGARPSQHKVILLQNVDPVPVTLSETAQGVVTVDCPFYNDRSCNRFSDVPYFPGMNPVPPVCRFAPAASYESFEVYEPAFEPHHFYQRVWEELTPEAKTAAVQFSPYAFIGMEKGDFEAMCIVFHISKNPSELIDQLAENGVVEEWSHMGALEAALSQLADGSYEDLELKEEGAKRVRSTKNWIEDEIHEYHHPSPYLGGYMSRDEYDEIRKKLYTGWDTPGTHLRFSPGFQTFVDQFRDQFGFPIDFTTPRDPETYIDENGWEVQKIKVNF